MANPRLRFKREDGTDYPDWEEKKLGEVLTQRRDIQTISEKAPLLSFTIEDGVIDPKDKKTNKRDFLIKDKENKKFQLTKYDDIIYNPANIKFGAIHRNKFGEGVVSPIYVILKTNQNPSFVEYSLKRESFISKTKKYLEGTVEKLRTLKPENFLSLSIFFPCLEEQEKIGSFLSDIDEVILTTSQEIKKLEELKKGVMQKIFSQEVRFKREDGTDYPDWEEKKLGDICIINPKTEKLDDKFIYIDLGSVEKGELIKNTILRKEKSPSRAQRVISKDDVLFQSVRPYNMGHFHYTNLFEIQVVASTGFFQLRMKNGLNKFLYQILYTKNFNEQVNINCVGSNYPAINSTSFGEIEIPFPCLEEQQKIADCLSAFDEAILLSKQELDKWKLLKKGFLQQMFV